MIDWEEIINAESVGELKDAKKWLFRENMRLENEKSEWALKRKLLLKEQERMTKELDELSRQITAQKKRLKEDNLFFEKKMAILQAGFSQLEEDRKAFEREKLLQQEKLFRQRPSANSSSNIAETLFRNATNPLALKKRYRDLVKIFHPDNLFGDAELAQQIKQRISAEKRRIAGGQLLLRFRAFSRSDLLHSTAFVPRVIAAHLCT